MTVNEIITKVEEIDTESNYWFVRTDYGKLFEQFIKGNYIAIKWDYLTLFEIKNSKEETIKNKIAQVEKIDLNTVRGKAKVSSTYNKIKTFISLKKDDYIIIPSRNSDRLAFGKILDDKVFEEDSAEEFKKRRKVKWYETKYINDLNPIFYQVKSNQHTISNVNRYASHIDRVIGNLFKKSDSTHYVLKIDKTDDVNFDELKTLMDNIKTLIQNINETFDFKENTDDFYIKIHLQSKGAVELIKKGKSLSILAYVIFLTSCHNSDDEQNIKIKQFMQENRAVLESTSTVIDSLKMDTNELTKPFKRDGN